MRKLKLLLVLCLVAIAASASKTVYFNPGAWDADGAQYAAWAWETDKAGNWYAMTDTNDDGIFEYTFDDAIGNLIFARISSLSNTTAFEGADIVYKTSDINRCEDGLLYVNRGSGNSPQIAICALNPSAGDDMTSFVTNPNFASSADGWTIEGQARLYNGTGFDGDKFIELTNWGSSWDATISQSINGLPNGYYVVKAASQMSGASEIWMKLVANGAESRFSRNGDTKGNILANGTETTLGGNGAVAGWRYTSVIVKVSDGTLAISCVGHSDVKERWGNFDHVTLTYFGDEIANNTDVTDFISNWDFWGCFNGNFNGWSISAPNGGNTWKNGDSNVEYWIGTAANGSFDYYQTVSGLPKGKYSISASMWNSTDNGGGSANGNAGVYGTSNENTVFKGVNVDSRNDALNTYTTDNIIVPNGELRLGVKNNGTMGARWFGVDWIKLQFVEPYISAFAKEIAAATDTPLTAGKWYKFTPASTGDHTFEATTLSEIIYTTTDQLKSEATGATAEETIALTEGTTYYIMSSSPQTLTISPQSFVYTVGEAAADVSYIQKGNTVTVTYASLGTDNPDPTLVKDFSGVTFGGNPIVVTTIANGFTFEVPTVTAANDYTLRIPANAIGYSDYGGAYNTEQNITLKTPAVFDGTYYLYDANSSLFLSRGKNYGSRAVVDLYGIPFNLVTNANNTSAIQFVDWTSKYLFKTDNTIYTDNASTGWKFVKSGDNYYLKTADDAHFAYVTADSIVNPTGEQGSATLWTLMSKAERDAIVNAYPTANKSNVIAAASISTTPAEFESYLAANFAAKDKTSEVGTARFTGSAGDWTFKNTTGNNPAYGTDWTEGFQNSGTWSQTINGLDQGIYKVTVNGFERKAGYALCNTLGAEGYEPVTAYFKANDEQLPLKSWYSDKTGTNNPDNTADAATAFNNDKYKNTIYTYVDASGELTLTIGKQDKASGSWVLFNNVTLTYYDSSISPEEEAAILAEAETEMAKPMKASLYQALASAKSAFEGSNTVPNYNALRTAIDNTVTSITSYAAMKTNYLDKIDALLASTNVYSTTNAEYIAYVGYKDAYDNYKEVGTADVENATANSLNAYSGGKGTRPVDLLLMPSWTIGGEATGDKFYQNTWSTEGESDGSDFLLPFYEYWTGDANVLNATTLQATQTGLAPNGVYEVSAWVRVRQSDAGDKIENAVTMQVGDGTPVDVSAGDKIGESKFYIKEFTATGKADGEGNLTITMSVAENSNINWLAFKNVNYIGVHTASFVNKDWENVYAHVWNDGSATNITGDWPGQKLTRSGEIHDRSNTYDVYTYTYKDNKKPDYIIFNNNSGTQTDELPFVDGMMYTNYVTFSPVYAVVGSNWAETDKAIFSAKWDQETTTDILTESAGVWSKTYSGQTLDRDSIAFKVIKKNYLEAPTAAGWYPGSNQKIVMPVKGIYDITITFNGNEGSPVVTGEATKVSEAVTISDKRWATTVTNSPLDFSGVTEFDAYTATVADSKVVLTKVDNVQAETGLVLHLKDAEAPDTYYVPVAGSSSTDKGSLKFSSTLTYNTWHNNGGENNKFYGLYVNGEGKAQFTLINCSAGSEVTIPAQKAFLLLRDGSSLARMEIVYDDETTGISNLNAETGAEGIYNLNGQRVTAPAKGRLYIVNGKKVVKK